MLYRGIEDPSLSMSVALAGFVIADVSSDGMQIQNCSNFNGTSRQRSGKGAVRKRFPLKTPRWEKTKLTIRYLYHENIS